MDSKERILYSQHRNYQSSSNVQMEVCKTTNYAFEEVRIKSFSSWKVHYPVDPVRLAKAGFYYTGIEDEVVCFSCHGHVKHWNYGDVVLKKHSELFPNCDFVNNRSNNVPLIQSKKSKCSLENKVKETTHIQPAKLFQVMNAVDYNKMKSLQERIKTFNVNWPLSNMDVVKTAQAGFFYLGLEDKVQCPFCKGIVSNWEDSDDPLNEHVKHFPWCDYLPSILSDFKPVKSSWFHAKSENLCGNMKKKDADSSMKCKLLDEKQEHMDLKKLGVHLHSDPAHPQQASYSARLRSFSTWPAGAPLSKEDLAKAGFFYIGISDHTKCFHCNGGLCNWEPGDDPWVEHARWFRNCDFLRLNKGDAFIDTCIKKYHSTELELGIPEQLPYMCSESLMVKVDVAMKSSLVEQVLETSMFPPYIIRAAVLRQIKETGAFFSTVDDLCVAVSYLKEEMEKEPLKMSSCKPSDLNILDIDLRKCNIGVGSDNNNAECAQIFLKEPSTVISNVNGKLGVDKASLSNDHCLCKICMDQEVGVVFLPCGHLLACTDCAPALKSCPMCRKTIQATVRAYLP